MKLSKKGIGQISLIKIFKMVTGSLCFALYVYKVASPESFQNWQISIHPDARESTQGASVSSSSVQNTLKFTAYPNKCAQSEIYIYVMSIALTLGSNQETSDSRALILSNLNITSTKWPGNILGRRHLIQKSRAQSQFGSKNKEILWEKKVSAIKLLIRERSNGGIRHWSNPSLCSRFFSRIYSLTLGKCFTFLCIVSEAILSSCVTFLEDFHSVFVCYMWHRSTASLSHFWETYRGGNLAPGSDWGKMPMWRRD